eukprot:2292930-Rhodomonas_salina.5
MIARRCNLRHGRRSLRRVVLCPRDSCQYATVQPRAPRQHPSDLCQYQTLQPRDLSGHPRDLCRYRTWRSRGQELPAPCSVARRGRRGARPGTAIREVSTAGAGSTRDAGRLVEVSGSKMRLAV